MISNFKNLLMLFAVFSLTSCSFFLKGKPAKQEILVIKAEELICLNDLGRQFKNIIKSESTDVEINTAFQCVEQTLNQFLTRVEGQANADSFSTDELYIIFSKFQKNADISRESVNDILILKKALLGGSETMITKTEITELKTSLLSLQKEVQKLLPYMKVFKFDATDGLLSRDTIDSAFSQLNSSLKVLITVSKIGKSEYEIADLKKLLLNLKVIQNEQKDLIDLAEKMKVLLIGSDQLKNTSEYERAIDNFTEVMSLYSYILHKDVQFEITSEKQMNKAVDFIDRFIDILADSVQFRKNSQIQTSVIDPLIEEILNKNLFPFSVQSSTFRSFYKKICIKVFGDQKNISIDSLDAIKLVHIRSLKKELAIFKLYLNFINSNDFKTTTERQSIDLLQEQLRRYKPQKDGLVLSHFSNDERQTILEGFEDLKLEFLSSTPTIYRSKKMVVAVNQKIWDVTWEDMTRALYGKLLARELLRGWGDGSVITEKGLIEWYTDFKLFAIETKTFDPRSDNTKTGQETFLQANLFTTTGNGDKTISKSEAFQYVNMLTSGGNQTFQEIRDGLTRADCNQSERDAFGYPWNDEACFYKDFKNNYKKYFSNLSYLVGYLNKLSDSDFKKYYDSLMVVSRRDAKSVGRIESADIRTMSMMLMYIESLFALADTDQNWTLSAAEIRAVFPRFTEFVTAYANLNAKVELEEWDQVLNPCRSVYPRDAFIKEAFVFMAYNGRLPKKEDVNNPADVGNIYECTKQKLGFSTAYVPFTFKGEIDRKTIINTFKILKTALESK